MASSIFQWRVDDPPAERLTRLRQPAFAQHLSCCPSWIVALDLAALDIEDSAGCIAQGHLAILGDEPTLLD